MGCFASLIAVLYLHFGYTELSLPNSVVPSLSVVLGLLLAFRANTSYARFYEGRQLWEQITSNSRNLARLIWCSIPERTQNDHLEKMRCMKLLLAFSVATKHHIRKEMGCNYYDLEHLLPPNWTPAAADDNYQYRQSHSAGQQPDAAALFTNPEATSAGPLEDRLGDNPDDPATGHRPNTFRRFVSDEDLPDEADADMSLPLEIVFRIGLYIAQMKADDKIDGNFVGTITTHLNNLIDCLGSLERIVNTPIPRAYNIHL
jgi:putative membrane protein